MGLFSIFKGSEAAAARSSDEALVERARSSARRRLIGAVVLLGVGVVAFPLIFETQPRPIPVDIPIEIPRKEGQPPVALPPATKAVAPAASKPAAAVTETKTEAPREPAMAATTPAPVTTASPATKVEPARTTAPKPEAKPEPKVEAKPEARTEVKAQTKPDAKSTTAVTAKPASEGVTPRYVVQVGAFAEAGAVREVRSRVEKLGLATYTQAIDTPSGARTRVRVGPFASRDEADKVAAKLKAAGLPGAVLTL